jgi:hypothetical protein
LRDWHHDSITNGSPDANRTGDVAVSLDSEIARSPDRQFTRFF